MNKKQIIILVSGVLITAIVVYYFFFRNPKTEVTAQPGTIVPPTSGATLMVNDSFPLQMGSHGNNVLELQKAINKINPDASLVTDGIFGKKTKDALQAYIGFSYYPVTEEKQKYILDYSALV